MKKHNHIEDENPKVEYWMNRALAAEKSLEEHLQKVIRTDPQLAAQYDKMIALVNS